MTQANTVLYQRDKRSKVHEDNHHQTWPQTNNTSFISTHTLNILVIISDKLNDSIAMLNRSTKDTHSHAVSRKMSPFSVPESAAICVCSAFHKSSTNTFAYLDRD